MKKGWKITRKLKKKVNESLDVIELTGFYTRSGGHLDMRLCLCLSGNTPNFSMSHEKILWKRKKMLKCLCIEKMIVTYLTRTGHRRENEGDKIADVVVFPCQSDWMQMRRSSSDWCWKSTRKQLQIDFQKLDRNVTCISNKPIIITIE
jgi:hypothetical protein